MSVGYSPRRSPAGCNRNSWLHVVKMLPKCSHQRHEKGQLRVNGNSSGPWIFGSRIRRSLAGKVPGLDPEFRPSSGAPVPLPLSPPTGNLPTCDRAWLWFGLGFLGQLGDMGCGQAVQNALQGVSSIRSCFDVETCVNENMYVKSFEKSMFHRQRRHGNACL